MASLPPCGASIVPVIAAQQERCFLQQSTPIKCTLRFAQNRLHFESIQLGIGTLQFASLNLGRGPVRSCAFAEVIATNLIAIAHGEFEVPVVAAFRPSHGGSITNFGHAPSHWYKFFSPLTSRLLRGHWH
jgi:hypothetical protein